MALKTIAINPETFERLKKRKELHRLKKNAERLENVERIGSSSQPAPASSKPRTQAEA